jgi:hypothetical protein
MLLDIFRKLSRELIVRIEELRSRPSNTLRFEPRIRPSEWPDYPGYLTKVAIDQIVSHQVIVDTSIVCSNEQADVGKQLLDNLVTQVRSAGLKWREPYISMDHEGYLIFEWNVRKQHLIVFAHKSAWYVLHSTHGKDKTWGPVQDFAGIWGSLHARSHV